MESIEGSEQSPEPHETIRLLAADQQRLARRVVTPWWCYCLLGGLLAVIFLCLWAEPHRPWVIAIQAVATFEMGCAIGWFSRLSGLGVIRPRGVTCWMLLAVISVFLLAAFAIVLLLALGGPETFGWGVPLSVLVGVLYALLGRWYDRALRQAMNAGR